MKECKEPAVLKRDGERETENKRENGNEKARERARDGEGIRGLGMTLRIRNAQIAQERLGGAIVFKVELEISIERGESNTEKDSECKSASEGQR